MSEHDDTASEVRAMAREMRAGTAEMRADLARLGLLIEQKLDRIERRLETLTDVVADLRADYNEHWHPETGEDS